MHKELQIIKTTTHSRRTNPSLKNKYPSNSSRIILIPFKDSISFQTPNKIRKYRNPQQELLINLIKRWIRRILRSVVKDMGISHLNSSVGTVVPLSVLNACSLITMDMTSPNWKTLLIFLLEMWMIYWSSSWAQGRS
jgi:hypothetical protein